MSWLKRHWFILIYSSLIGIFSHIFWGDFTHSNGFLVQHIKLLQGSTVDFDALIRKADLRQAMGSVFGAMVIVFILLLPRLAEFEFSQFIIKLKYWFGVALITLITLILRNRETLGDFVPTIIAGVLLGLIIAPLLLKLNFKRIT